MRAVVVGGLLVAAAAHAHYVPADRMIVVQAEADAVAVLVTYRPPPGARTQATGGEAHGGTALLRALLAVQAVAGLTLAADGAPLRIDSAQVKLAEDPPGSGRVACAVLLSARRPAGTRRVTVSVSQLPDPTRTQWVDRSGGRVVSFGPVAPGRWVSGRSVFELVWKEGP